MQRKRSSGERRADVRSAFSLLVYKICIVDKSFLSTLQKSFKEWNIFPQALVHCKWYFLNWPLQSTRSLAPQRSTQPRRLWKGPQNERRARELLFWDMYVNIYIFGQCDSDLVLAWHKSGRGIDEGGFIFFLFFKDLRHDCILTRQLWKCKHDQLSAAVSLGVVTDCLSLITVDQRTSNLSRMIIRCIQRMKQAYVHVLIFTELTICWTQPRLLCIYWI